MQKEPELMSSHRHSKSTATYGTVHSEKDLTLAEHSLLTTKIKGPPPIGQQRQNTWSCKKPHPRHSDLHTIRRDLTNTELLPEKEGIVPHIWHPNPWNLHGRDEPLPKPLAVKHNRVYTQESQRAVSNSFTLKGLLWRLTSTKAAV